MTIEEVLGICIECKKIRVSKEKNLWLKREDDVRMYDDFMAVYEGKLTHTYCPEDFEKKMKKIKKIESLTK